MKSKPLNRVISIALLICSVMTAIPAPSSATETGIFFNHTTARRLLVDLRYARSTADDATKRYSLCADDRALLEQKTAGLDLKCSGLEKDKTEYLKESERFKGLYVQADQERVKAETGAPSRFRWFVGGFLTAVAAGIAAVLAVR